MQLFYAPGACSLGIHVLLEEIGAPYEAVPVALREGAQFKPPFTTINPKSKVPVLTLGNGSVLTEYPAIAYYLAATHPTAGLLPPAGEPMARALEAADYCVSTVHMQAFSRVFRPDKFAPTATDHDAVKAQGQSMFDAGLARLDAALAGQDWIVGDYSFADSAIFYICFWRAGRMKQDLPPNVAAHYARMLARPAVQRAMAQEGLV
ncbi:glutathione S-transferase family protein [Humitalea sp. 24SJ18S-53]|uniref:glutathione S-transferase family protein n=1 Tax=Humitalea sp. 24SJ18S-53 TaxID=3422307 RepID=UPI003D667FD3